MALNVINTANTQVFISFLMGNVLTGEIKLASLELNNASPITGLPTGALNSRKKETQDIFGLNQERVSTLQGREIVSEQTINLELMEDFSHVLKQDVHVDITMSRDRLINIFQGAPFMHNGALWRVLGTGGNINLDARMTGSTMLEKHWKWFLNRQIEYIKDGTAYDITNKPKLMTNPFLPVTNTEALGLVVEVYFYTGTNEIRNMLFPLSVFQNILTNMDNEVNKFTTDMMIKADGLETHDLMINGGFTENEYFYLIEEVKFYSGTLTPPPTLEANKKYLFINEDTGKISLIDNKIDVTDTTPLYDGTKMYVRRHKMDTSGASTNPCDDTSAIEYSPVYIVAENFKCTNNAGVAKYSSKAVQWLINEETTITNKEAFLLHIYKFDSEKGDFALVDSTLG